ncbi:clustered mitochondria protein homolog [Episyrphus balteatus]|uniref:clustered mitochondria protein homolog n=1 Tax=Episyrphus balteatus TaxID=286459 RepID=UPI002486B952|nr:clustered mitochondria protein homolog [Episyrphus balteatus]
MSERINGIDPYTIVEHAHLALYCFANRQLSTLLKLLYKAKYLLLLICVEDHPEMALIEGYSRSDATALVSLQKCKSVKSYNTTTTKYMD